MSSTEKSSLEKLPRYQERKFLPKEINFSQKAEVIAIYEKLLGRAIASAPELEQWLLDRSELETALDQAGSVLYIRMTCQTNDQEKDKAYQHFIEAVIPAVKPLDDQLNKKYLEAARDFPLDPAHFALYDRRIRSDMDLFRQENVALQTEVARLSQEYQTIFGAMTINLRGKEQPLPQMGKFLLEPDRGVREAAWRATAQRRLQDRAKLDELFDKMLKLRDTIARNAGLQNFCEYQFRGYHRFDYTQQDCEKYHQAIERLVVPLWKEILEKRRQSMQVDKLRPWDTAVDPLGKGPLKPFQEVAELVEGVKNIFLKMDQDLGKQFSEMMKLGLLDLASYKGKAPGGYQTVLAEARKPFIFMNAVGVDDDVRTLLHESGHAFHALASSHHPLFAYRHAPMEFCEVASMSMELLGGEYLSVFYNTEDWQRSNFIQLEEMVYILIWVATIDAFQQWIYENPQHTAEERSQAWLRVQRRFGADLLDWSGLEKEQGSLWHRQLHIFEVPFYYIEYGIAQLGALQLWARAKKNLGEALSDYRKALSLGSSRPLPELFAAAGLKFDFSEKTIAPLMQAIKVELQ